MGLVLGVESVPDGVAGLLAGVSPLSGQYAYLLGTIGGSLVTGSAFMAVPGHRVVAGAPSRGRLAATATDLLEGAENLHASAPRTPG